MINNLFDFRKTTTLNKMWWVIQDIWSLKINEFGTETSNNIFSNI